MINNLNQCDPYSDSHLTYFSILIKLAFLVTFNASTKSSFVTGPGTTFNINYLFYLLLNLYWSSFFVGFNYLHFVLLLRLLIFLKVSCRLLYIAIEYLNQNNSPNYLRIHYILSQHSCFQE